MKAPKGRTIFMPEQAVTSIYHLHEGVVNGVRTLEDGHEITELFVPPNFIGLIGFTDMNKNYHKTHMAEARAITPVVYCKIKKEAMWQLLNNSEARAKIFNLICERVVLSNLLSPLPVRDDVSNRILTILKILCQYVAKDKDQLHILQDISHDELALMAGTTRATVTRTLNKLENNGYIELGRRHIIIPNCKKLYRLTTIAELDNSSI
jgi:CRP/FNR family transcriptional regulator, cyclic AMP receptor protein